MLMGPGTIRFHSHVQKRAFVVRSIIGKFHSFAFFRGEKLLRKIRYDMDFQGNFYPLCNFVRSAAIAALDG